MLLTTRMVGAVAVIAPIPIYAFFRDMLQVDPETSALIGLAAQIPLVFLFMWFYNRMDDKQRAERQETLKTWTETIDAISTRNEQVVERTIASNREWADQQRSSADQKHSDGMARLGDALAANTEKLATVGETLKQVSQILIEHDTWERQAQAKTDFVVQLLQEERQSKGE